MGGMATPGTPHDDDPLVGNIQYELTLISRHYLRTQQVRPHHALDLSAYVLLSRLELEDPMSLKELASAFRLDVSTINRQVSPLVRTGLVEYVLDPEGGSARKVRPTRQGLEALESDRRCSSVGLERVIEHWSADDRRQLHTVLRRFNEDVERLQGTSWPRPDH